VTDEVQSQIAEYIRTKVAAAFMSPDDIRTSAAAVFADECEPETLDVFVEEEVRRAIEEHLRAEMAWPAETDCDRLDAAFADLERDGIVARQDFSCCGTCGAADIEGEMENAGASTRGYAFYHMQDTDSAAEGSGLYLSYGSAEEGEGPALAVAREVVETLRKHRINADWDGSWSHRIRVPLTWQRRYRK